MKILKHKLKTFEFMLEIKDAHLFINLFLKSRHKKLFQFAKGSINLKKEILFFSIIHTWPKTFREKPLS